MAFNSDVVIIGTTHFMVTTHRHCFAAELFPGLTRVNSKKLASSYFYIFVCAVNYFAYCLLSTRFVYTAGNIPYGQSSAKLQIIKSSGCHYIRSFGHHVIIPLISTLLLSDWLTYNIRTYKYASQTNIRDLCFIIDYLLLCVYLLDDIYFIAENFFMFLHNTQQQKWLQISFDLVY